VFDTPLKDHMVLLLNTDNIFGFHFEESVYFY
jgi:hypothetical protein